VLPITSATLKPLSPPHRRCDKTVNARIVLKKSDKLHDNRLSCRCHVDGTELSTYTNRPVSAGAVLVNTGDIAKVVIANALGGHPKAAIYGHLKTGH